MPMSTTPEPLFQMLSDVTRLRTLMLLAAEQELCVCELTHALNQSQPKISRHLAHLREAGLLLARREGQWMYYRIDPALPDWARSILHHTLLGNAGREPFRSDRAVLKEMPDRPGAACCT
jgi:ArsR family transcriptional regulator, arsenate/arsenite/antimonite-responsive transcriptional repressor